VSDRSFSETAAILLLDEETISKHVDKYRTQQKLSIQTGGSSSKLSQKQECELAEHLKSKIYLKASEICDVARVHSVCYTVSGMLVEKEEFFLHKATVPAKADPEKWARFVEEYKKLKESPQPLSVCDNLSVVVASEGEAIQDSNMS
jgi:transposase